VPGDTHPAALEAQLSALRRLGPSGRVRLAAEMSEDARRIAFEAERLRHPGISYAEARRAVLLRLWGAELGARLELTRFVAWRGPSPTGA
jgi:hypothetical protein